MNGWLLDTNVIAEVSGAKPDVKVAKWIESLPEYTLYLSIVDLRRVSERHPASAAGRQTRPRLQRAVAAMEARFTGRALSMSDRILLRWGAIRGEVKRLTGHSPSVVDTLPAATAIEHDLYVATRNVADVANSGAVVFNPWKDAPELFLL